MNRRHTVEVRFNPCNHTEDKPWAVQERYNGRLVKQIDLETKDGALAYGTDMANVYGAVFVGCLPDRD